MCNFMTLVFVFICANYLCAIVTRIFYLMIPFVLFVFHSHAKHVSLLFFFSSLPRPSLSKSIFLYVETRLRCVSSSLVLSSPNMFSLLGHSSISIIQIHLFLLNKRTPFASLFFLANFNRNLFSFIASKNNTKITQQKIEIVLRSLSRLRSF